MMCFGAVCVCVCERERERRERESERGQRLMQRSLSHTSGRIRERLLSLR